MEIARSSKMKPAIALALATALTTTALPASAAPTANDELMYNPNIFRTVEVKACNGAREVTASFRMLLPLGIGAAASMTDKKLAEIETSIASALKPVWDTAVTSAKGPGDIPVPIVEMNGRSVAIGDLTKPQKQRVSEFLHTIEGIVGEWNETSGYNFPVKPDIVSYSISHGCTSLSSSPRR